MTTSAASSRSDAPDNFSEWSLEDARAGIKGLVDDNADTNKKFVDGDHWQDGDGWVGPHPSSDDEGSSDVMAEIRNAFVSRNVIGEVVERHASFVVGKEPRWALVLRRPLEDGKEPSEAEQSMIDEAEAALTQWWDARRAHTIIQNLARMATWAARGTLRLYVPKGKLTTSKDGEKTVTTITATDLADALSKIWPDLPDHDQAAVVENPDTKEDCGVFLFGSDDPNKPSEIAELSYLDGEKTIIRIVGSKEDEQSFPLSLGKRLTMFQIERPLLISQQIQEAQRALNLAATMIPRNVITGGFLERVLLNAQMPGRWELDEKGNRTRFIPEPFATGAGTTAFISGLETFDQSTGKTSVSTPDVRYREPIPVTSSVDAKTEHYKDILEESKQGHIISGTDSKLGWKSREQLRADSDKALELTKVEIEAAGRWLLETVLAMAEAFMNAPGKYTNTLRAEFVCLASSGPISIDERKENRESAKDGFLSRETAMERNGVDDVDAELTRMAAEPDARADLAVKQATALKTLTDAGATIAGAAKFLGIPEERALLLLGTDDGNPPKPLEQ